MNIDFPIKNLKTSFGELAVESKTPKINLMFQYNIDAEFWVINTTNTATITQSNGKVVAQTGATANTFSQLYSKDVLKYVPGMGGSISFTALFTTGVSGSEQTVGLGDQEDGFFFGFNGAAFGILRRRGGQKNIQEITITGVASGTGNITITLDGDDTIVAVTSGDSIQEVVDKIVAADFSGAGVGWNTYKVDNTTVKFIAMLSGASAGASSFADTDTTGVTASAFSDILSGASSTDTWVAQTAWNIDKMDGTGPSGQTLDVTKGNVYKIQYQWLGFGHIVFSIENSSNGILQEVHRIRYANLNTVSTINNPSLPVSSNSITEVPASSSTQSTGPETSAFLNNLIVAPLTLSTPKDKNVNSTVTLLITP